MAAIHADATAPVDDIADDMAEQLQMGGDEDPLHACKYCGISDVNCVVKCLGCDRWFCNGRGRTSSSHIITHLVRARHKGVMLHPESPLGDTVPECYTCGSRNVFVLGFIPAKGDAVVMLLCRSPCAYAANSKDIAWDASQWSPLIENRSFLPWFVHVPSAETQHSARLISAQQITKLEDLWRENERATLADVEQSHLEEELTKTLLQYDSPEQYQNILGSLVSVEAEYDKRLKESLVQHNVTVRWEETPGRRILVWLRLPQLESGELRLAVGDELLLKYSGSLVTPWESHVNVVRMPPSSSMEVAAELPAGTVAPTECTMDYTVEFIWVGVTYQRMQAALKRFVRDNTCISSYLRNKILGRNIPMPVLCAQLPRRFSAPGLAELNHSQVSAVKTALTRPLSLIQGPPGTGKTVTSATIVYHLCKLGRGKVLVCAPSNVAVDQLTERLHRTSLRVVRLVSRTREAISSQVQFLALHEQATKVDPNTELARLMRQKKQHGELSSSDERRYTSLLRNFERDILSAADVICTTCSSSADSRLRSLTFSTVLIDEATQAVEPECLTPVVRGCKQLILVGDHQQLGPVVMNRKVAEAGMNRSLFERLVVLGTQPMRLEVQYRMHPCLSEFPSNMFYDGMLQYGVTAQDRLRRHVAVPWPVPLMPMMFYQNLGQEEISGSGTSYLNRTEASSVEKLVTMLLKAGIAPEHIGVVTPYEGQRSFVINHMQLHGTMHKDLYRDVEVASVDAFQGREKDYIIVSCVRSNDRSGIGFLSDPRRLNVALTRARYGLIIVGNPKVLSRNPLWYHLLIHFKHQGALVEGPLSNLQVSMIQFGAPPADRSRRVPVARAATEALAMDPIHAPFRAAYDNMQDAWNLNAHLLSYNRSDRLHAPYGGDDDLQSQDGFRSQASVADAGDEPETSYRLSITSFT